MKAVAILGPTACGKTALSLALAPKIRGEILVCDSMQVYRGLDIGTAKPTASERAVCPHHLVDLVSPETPFNAADYADAAMQTVREITARGNTPVFCGGTGLYLDAVRTLRHGDMPASPSPALRARLTEEAETPEGRDALYQRLSDIDPDAAAATHPNNVRRVIRALEIYETTGQTKTYWDRRASQKNPDLDILPIGLTFRDRETLYRRIDARVDAMIEAGLIEETKRLRDAGLFEKSPTAAAAIGYKELLTYLNGEAPLTAALEDLKTATRRYAKRQLTYFRRMPDIVWLFCDGKTADDLAEEILPRVTAYLAES